MVLGRRLVEVPGGEVVWRQLEDEREEGEDLGGQRERFLRERLDCCFVVVEAGVEGLVCGGAVRVELGDVEELDVVEDVGAVDLLLVRLYTGSALLLGWDRR